MHKDGRPQVRKLGKDYYIKCDDLHSLFEFFSEDALANIMEMDEDEVSDYEMGEFEGIADVLDELSKTVNLMVTEKRLSKIENLQQLTEEFEPVDFKRNRKIKTE